MLCLPAPATEMCQSQRASRRNLPGTRGECGEPTASGGCAFGPCLCPGLWGPALLREALAED